MKADDALVFIDASQYLDLYRAIRGKQLLETLLEQKDHIFVTVQIVNGVQRNKLKIAAGFLTRQFEQLKVHGVAIPDHLFDISGDTAATLRKKLHDIDKRIKEVNDDLKNAAVQTLRRISLSRDEVSKALAALFSKAVTYTAEEFQRARDRKEIGNPPGKKSDSLGDQLTWEQLLSNCKDESKLWIISNDADYWTEYSDEVFLNPLLYQDLARTPQPTIDVFCFKNLGKGFDHFVKTTGVKADKLPSQEALQEIESEQDALPPLGRLSTLDVANDAAIQSQWWWQWASPPLIRPPGGGSPP